jgi:hypothetical protein
MPKFIVLSGKKQAGKTTAALFIKDYINEVYPDLIVKMTSFATPIKDFCYNVLGLSYEQIYGDNTQKNSVTHILWDTMPHEILNKYASGEFFFTRRDGTKSRFTTWPSGPMTAREVMQIFGTDIMRHHFDYDVWAKAPFRKDWGATDLVIIDDCRFPNEALMTLENDGLLIRLLRNPLNDQHSSELAMDQYDVSKYHLIINNRDMSLVQLQAELHRFLHINGYTK